MTAPDSAAVRDLFTRMDAAQLELWQFKLQPDVSWLDTVKKGRILVPFFEAKPGHMVSVLSRPRQVTDAWFAPHSALDPLLFNLKMRGIDLRAFLRELRQDVDEGVIRAGVLSALGDEAPDALDAVFGA